MYTLFFIDLIGNMKNLIEIPEKIDLRLTAVEKNQPACGKRTIFPNTQKWKDKYAKDTFGLLTLLIRYVE